MHGLARKTSRRMALLLFALLVASPFANARAGNPLDQDAARRALESGEILPLRTILNQVESSIRGQVLEIELEQKEGLWIYEIKILQSDGLVVKLNFDAKSGNLIRAKSK